MSRKILGKVIGPPILTLLVILAAALCFAQQGSTARLIINADQGRAIKMESSCTIDVNGDYRSPSLCPGTLRPEHPLADLASL